MVKDDYDNYLDDLFGGPDASEQCIGPYGEPYVEPAARVASNTVNQPPMPMPMPLPMPLPPSDFSDTKVSPNTKLQETSHLASYASGETSEQKQADITAQQADITAQQADITALFQQFLAQQAAGAAPAASLYNTTQVAWPTQLEPKANPPPAGAKISHSRDKNGDNRIGQYDWYDSFPVRENWVASDGGSSRQVPIKYTKQGELKLPASFDRHVIEAYVRGCAERGIPLRLWVQNVPTMHADRYPNIRYHRCRAQDCPEKGTLGRGAYQVCFDEHPTETTNGRFDPFYVAGYIHLFCLEEMMSLAHLMQFADVQPDVREFPLERRNPMSLHRDGVRVLEDVYYEWKSAHHDAFANAGVPISKSPRKRDSDCLFYSLTRKKLETQPSTRQKMRDQRKGNDISKYYGNLRKRAEFNAAAKKKRKMARFSSDNSSVVELGDALPSPAPSPSPTAPTAKRPRTGSAYTRPVLQTAAAYAMQSQPSAVTGIASPLRRSRRLSGACAAPSPLPGVGVGVGVANAARNGGRRSLNVRTDQMSLALDGIDYSSNIDGLIFDFKNACEQYMSQDLGNGNAHYLHFGQVTTPGGVYGVDTMPVPYDLRATQARRETAIRQTSARISLTEGIRCDEKRLIKAANSPGSPRKTPITFHRASQALRPASQLRQGTEVETAPLSARRVTRSMSRHVSAADVPPEQGYSFHDDLLYPQGLDDFEDGYFNFDGYAQS